MVELNQLRRNPPNDTEASVIETQFWLLQKDLWAFKGKAHKIFSKLNPHVWYTVNFIYGLLPPDREDTSFTPSLIQKWKCVCARVCVYYLQIVHTVPKEKQINDRFKLWRT